MNEETFDIISRDTVLNFLNDAIIELATKSEKAKNEYKPSYFSYSSGETNGALNFAVFMQNYIQKLGLDKRRRRYEPIDMEKLAETARHKWEYEKWMVKR